MSKRARLLTSLAGAGLLSAAAMPAAAQTQTYVDLQAGLGYSTNPLLQIGDDFDSGFGRISAYGYHGWRSERGETSFSAYVENSSYFRRLGNQQLFDVTARTIQKSSETVQLFGSLGFSGDLGGQLRSRFFGAPLEPLPENPSVPPNPEIVVDPDIASLNRRQYRIVSQGGVTVGLSPRDYLSTALGYQRSFLTGDAKDLDYNTYNFSSSWQRRLNENSNFGARLIADYVDYRAGRSTFSYGPQITADTRLDRYLQLRGAIGIVRVERDLGAALGKDSTFDLALDASLCRNLQYDQLCATAARRTQASITGAAPVTNSLTGSYARQLDANSNVQLSLGFFSSEPVREVGIARQTYYSVGGSFDRRLTDRLSAGINVSGRRLSTSGPDPKSDLGGSFFIRNRFGSVR